MSSIIDDQLYFTICIDLEHSFLYLLIYFIIIKLYFVTDQCSTHIMVRNNCQMTLLVLDSAKMDLNKPQILTYAEKSLNYTVHCARWVPSSSRFVALGERPRGTGAFQVYELEVGDKGPEIKCLVDSEKTGAFRCGTFAASDSRQIAVGDFLGKMSIIDLEAHQKPVLFCV